MHTLHFGVAGGEGRRSYPEPAITIEAADPNGDLMTRVHEHDAQAFSELCDRYGRLVYSGILRVVRDHAAAEDLAQETFLRIWSRTQNFDAQRGSLATWLLTIARNRAIDYVRSSSGRQRNAVSVDDAVDAALRTDMEEDLLTSERARRIKAAIEALPPNQRRAIELSFFEGLSQPEVAERLGRPLGTVKSWVRAALKTLRADLEAFAPARSGDGRIAAADWAKLQSQWRSDLASLISAIGENNLPQFIQAGLERPDAVFASRMVH